MLMPAALSLKPGFTEQAWALQDDARSRPVHDDEDAFSFNAAA